MSEPHSLFAKIHIDKDNFLSFQKSKPMEPKLENDWLEWWNSKEMYGKTDLRETDIYFFENPTNESVINFWEEEETSLTFSDYDSNNETGHFGIIMFSDNYLEMIPLLAFLKSVAEFKTEHGGDFAIIYDYYWGDNTVSAFIKYENGNALFDNNIQVKTDLNPTHLKYSDEYLTNKLEEFLAARPTEDQD